MNLLPLPAIDRIMDDHGLTAAHIRTLHRPRNMGGTVMYDRGYMQGFRDALAWVLPTQHEWADLPIPDAITELRKGEASIYHPLFADDPMLRVECPTDGWVVVGVEGFCDRCGYPFDDMPQIGGDAA